MPRTEEERRAKIDNATSQKHNNPCLKEQRLSLKCLDEMQYDKEKCERYFDNYRRCQNFWIRVTKDRRINGIRPYLPPPEEREAVKKRYMEEWAERHLS